MSKPFVLLTVAVGILASALAVMVVLALLPYLGIIGLVLLALLIAAGVGVLLYGVHHLWDRMVHGRIQRRKARVELALLERELDYVRPNEYGPITAIRTEGGYSYTPHVVEAPPRLGVPAPRNESIESALVIPRAPAFRDMCHLITAERLVLCYTEHGPASGSVEDLLSMAIVGKPGRGKTTALLYYVTMLLGAEAEVHVWDPHGSMNELAACHLNLSYTDALDDLPASLVYLSRELDERSLLYKQRRQVKHPLLLLVDELPVIGDYEKVLKKRGNQEEQLPTFLIKRLVLEARKWRCFFIASGQSTDAEILPTRVTENLSSRIIFFSSDRRARMAGLEQEAVKKFLPVIRRAGSGVMIFDCSSWDEPVLGAIPEITVEDMQRFFRRVNTVNKREQGEDVHTAFTMPLGHSHVVHLPPIEPQSSAVSPRHTTPLGLPVNPGNAHQHDGDGSSPRSEDGERARDWSPEDEARIVEAALAMQTRDGVVVRTRLLQELGENRKFWPILKAVLDKYGL